MGKVTDVDLTKPLKTGIAKLDEMLSGDVPVGDLHVFVAAPSHTVKTILWRETLRNEHTALIFGFDLEMTPEFGPEDVGVPPPDDPKTPKPGS